MTKPLYIFDLDGTLALIDHRRHFVERPACPFCGWCKDCQHDRPGTGLQRRPSFEPNKPVINIMGACMLDACMRTGDVWVFSDRSDEVRKETEAWLHKHTPLCFDSAGPCPGFICLSDVLVMRKAGDFTPDDQLKRQWYENMLSVDKERLVCVFDDRQKVVDMWRSLGVACLQVAPGEF